MLVQRVLMPGGGRESWTLLGDDGEVVEPAERYLAYLAAIERSPNTVRAYAVSLKLWFEFLQVAGTRWDEAGVEDVARFVAWLRAPAANVIVLADGRGARRPATVNWYLAGVFGFYFSTVAESAGVSRGWLYRQDQIRDLINRQRALKPPAARRLTAQRATTDSLPAARCRPR